MDIFKVILSSLYAVTGIIGILAYIPTVKDLAKKIESANVYSYALWAFSSIISYLYALIIISDFLLELMTGLNFLFCFAIFVMALKLKHTHLKKKKIKA